MDYVTCPNCKNHVPSGITSCNSCGTPIQQQNVAGFCSSCGNPLADKLSPCPNCGHTKTIFNAPPSAQQGSSNSKSHNILYKDEGTTIILAIILGLFGFNGVGHLYIGKIGKGVMILVISFILFFVGIATVFFGGIILLIIHFVIFIWQIVDAKKLCRQYNYYMMTTGKEPDNW